MSGEVSARPDRLDGWAEAAAEIRRALLGRIRALTASYDSFQGSGSIPVANPGLMSGALPSLLTRFSNNEVFVRTVGQAFANADAGGLGVRNPDGTVTVPGGAFDRQFEDTARALGLDPAALLAAAIPITVDDPIAGGVPRTSGFVSDPVCTATGHLVEQEDDFVWPARLSVLAMRRTYSSRFVGAGPLGRGWACWASATCLRGDDGSAAYQGPDGQLAVLPATSEGWARVPGLLATITEAESDGGLTMTWDLHSDHPGQHWHFDAEGLLRRVEGVMVGTSTFDYDEGLLASITHDGGRVVSVSWDGARIASLVSSDGRQVTFQYNEAGDLIAVEQPSGACRYHPDERGLLVEVWDADDVRLCFNTFDAEGRVTSQVSPFGRTTIFEYQPGRRTIVSDTERGPRAVFEHDAAGRLIALVDDDGHRMARQFDALGNCTIASGFDGAQTIRQLDEAGRVRAVEGPHGTESFAYDDNGRVLEHRNAAGAVLRFDYGDDPDSPTPQLIEGPEGWRLVIGRDALGQVGRVEDADGVAVIIERDADGNVVATTNGMGATTRYRHHPTGQPIEVVAPDGARVTFDVDGAGRPLAMTTPLGDTWRLEWSPAGRLRASIDPAGHRTEVSYASHGNVDRIADPTGAGVELVHDHLQRLVRVMCPDGAKWEFDHTALGALAAVVDPSGATWRYGHDPEGRLVEVTDPLGGIARFRHDPAGRLLSETDRTGATSSVVRDAAGAVTAVTTPDGATTTLARDGWGRPIEVIDPDEVAVRYTYTAAGRMSSVRTGEGRGYDVAYDRAGRTESVTGADGATTSFEWDECDRLVRVIRPSGRVETHTYDQGGRRVETRVGDAGWRATYDHSGRPVELIDPSGATTRYGYDPRGKLVSATDANGGTVRIRYDIRGNPVAVVDQRGSTWSSRYDANRRVIARTDPLGRTTAIERDLAGGIAAMERGGERTTYRRDAEGRLTDILVDGQEVVVLMRDRSGHPVLVHEPSADRTISLTWTRAGRLAAVDRGGRAIVWTRDGDGAIATRTAPNGAITHYERDASGRVITMQAGDAEVRYSHDLDGMLTGLRADGVEREWLYDDRGLVIGYRESTDDGDQHAATIRRDAAGRVTAVEATAGTKTYRYDAAGQLVAAEGPAGSWTFRYDEAGRLVGEEGPRGTRSFGYDDAHQLLRIDAPDGITTLTYDGAGRRIGEDGPSGPVHYEWDRLGRIQAVRRRGRRHTLDVDALGVLAGVDGTPLDWDVSDPVEELISGDDFPAAGGEETDDQTDPWGARLDGGGDRIGLGAFGEVEVAGLLWLRNRVYDPNSRQFLSPDPLPGGPGTPFATHPYQYAGNDPVGHVDPLGLAPISLADYEEIRRQETGTQWGNIALVGLTAASFFVPGGPLVATLVGAGLGMAPGVIEGIQTGNWDAGAIVAGGVLGAAGGRIGFAFGAGARTTASAAMRGAGGGFSSGIGGQLYDLTPLPGADGTFDPERVVLDTAIGAVGGGIGYRVNPPEAPIDVPTGARLDIDVPSVAVDVNPPAAPRADFVAGPPGSNPPVPVSQSRMREGFEAAGFPSEPTASPGTQYTLPDGSRVRLMEPTDVLPRRASFENANGQPVDPFTGKPPQPPRGLPRADRLDYVRARTHVEQDP